MIRTGRIRFPCAGTHRTVYTASGLAESIAQPPDVPLKLCRVGVFHKCGHGELVSTLVVSYDRPGNPPPTLHAAGIGAGRVGPTEAPVRRSRGSLRVCDESSFGAPVGLAAVVTPLARDLAGMYVAPPPPASFLMF
jgi:hypothetical protein